MIRTTLISKSEPRGSADGTGATEAPRPGPVHTPVADGRAPVAATATALAALALSALTGAPAALHAQTEDGAPRPRGPVGPSPYEVVTHWVEPFQAPGFAFGGTSGIFAESPDRIFVVQRGETRLPRPVPDSFSGGHAGSVGINVLTDTEYRTWRNVLYTLNGEGEVLEIWDHWDHLFEGSDGPGPHRLRISPYDPERRVWVVHETFHQIYVFSNDGSELVTALGEKGVPGDDENHFARPQDVAFLPDGRILVADGLDNHRIVILDEDGEYISEFGGHGTAPGQFNGIHAVRVGPDGLIFALDRSGGRINVFRTTDDPAEVEHVDTWDGFGLPLSIVVNEESVWITDLDPMRFVKLDFEGNRLYTWLVPDELPDGFLEVHEISVDSAGNLYGGDNQYGRAQKLVPRPGADPDRLIEPPFVPR